MHKLPAALIGLLLAVRVAAAQGQLQRTYVFPQTVSATAGEPGVINAMCLDPKVIGAPGTADRITCWEHPEAIIIRRLRDAQVVGTQTGLELVQGATPWVHFEGASDCTGRVALRARVVRPQADVAYEVQFVTGTAAARPQEGLSGLFLSRLREFDGSLGALNRDLQELHGAFPPDGLLTRLYEEFARQTLYPGLSRDVPARELERSTRLFVGSVEIACRATDERVQALLAALLAGTPEPTDAQRAFFARHGITIGDVELASDELAAMEQFRGAYTATMLQACYALCCGEPSAAADGLALARRGLERLVAWRRADGRCDGADIAYALGPAFEVTVRGGEPVLGREGGPTAVNLAQLVRRLRSVRTTLTSDRRRSSVEKALVDLRGRLTKLNIPSPLPGDFWHQEPAQQTRALVLAGEAIRGLALPSGLQELLHTGPPLSPALRVALAEGRWLIEARGLTNREQRALERHVAEFEGLIGVACTLLADERTREHLACPPATAGGYGLPTGDLPVRGAAASRATCGAP